MSDAGAVAMPCPCGSGLDDVACCAPIIAGAPAPTAVGLMRSRYTAYVRDEIDYLFASHDPATRVAVDRRAIEDWSRNTSWGGLEILGTEDGGPDDTTGIVEFVARGITRGRAFEQRERSRFRKDGDHWLYVERVAPPVANTPIRREATPGRNDPCPCGSGAKYKRCHGA